MSRRIVLWFGIVALTIVCMSIAVLIRVNGTTQPQPSPTPSPTATTGDVQQTLFVAVRSGGGVIADAVTLGARSNETAMSASWLSMQPGLAVGVDETGQITLANVDSTEPGQTGPIVANQLGISINNVMVLDRLAFAALVDSVNGVTVTVTRPIWVVLPDGKVKVVARPGVVTLYGPAAADYVIALMPGEVQADRMARFDDVLRKVIVKLPQAGDRTRDIIASLGSSSRTLGSISSIARTLLAVRTALLDNTLTSAAVPATKAQVESQTIYTLLPQPTFGLMRQMFEPSLLLPGTEESLPRVRLYAAGVDDVTAAAANEALAQMDQSMVWGGSAPRRKISAVFVSAARFQAMGVRSALALGLPASVVGIDPKRSVGVPVTVWLAADTPLFVPLTSPSPSAS